MSGASQAYHLGVLISFRCSMFVGYLWLDTVWWAWRMLGSLGIWFFPPKKKENGKGAMVRWEKPIGKKNEQQTSWSAYGVGCSVCMALTVLSGLRAIGRVADTPQNTAFCPANAKVTASLPRLNSKRALCREGPVDLGVWDIWLLSVHLSTIFGLRNTNLLIPSRRVERRKWESIYILFTFPFFSSMSVPWY